MRHRPLLALATLPNVVVNYVMSVHYVFCAISDVCTSKSFACVIAFNQSINQSINQVYFQINMYKNEEKVHISQIDRKKVEVEVNNL